MTLQELIKKADTISLGRVMYMSVNGEKAIPVRDVVLDKVAHQSVVIMATSQDDAESRVCDFAERHPENWVDEETAVRDCTSVLMTDGSWEFCNCLGNTRT